MVERDQEAALSNASEAPSKTQELANTKGGLEDILIEIERNLLKRGLEGNTTRFFIGPTWLYDASYTVVNSADVDTIVAATGEDLIYYADSRIPKTVMKVHINTTTLVKEIEPLDYGIRKIDLIPDCKASKGNTCQGTKCYKLIDVE